MEHREPTEKWKSIGSHADSFFQQIFPGAVELLKIEMNCTYFLGDTEKWDKEGAIKAELIPDEILFKCFDAALYETKDLNHRAEFDHLTKSGWITEYDIQLYHEYMLGFWFDLRKFGELDFFKIVMHR